MKNLKKLLKSLRPRRVPEETCFTLSRGYSRYLPGFRDMAKGFVPGKLGRAVDVNGMMRSDMLLC